MVTATDSKAPSGGDVGGVTDGGSNPTGRCGEPLGHGDTAAGTTRSGTEQSQTRDGTVERAVTK